MNITKKDLTLEKNDVVKEYFKDANADVKLALASFSKEQKEKLLKSIKAHYVFYENIMKEPYEKPSYRIEMAKFRVNTLYPQLIKLINE